MKPVLVAGEINADLVFTGCNELPAFGREVLVEGFRQGPGSSSMICAMGMAKLGDSVLFAGVAGQDSWGDYCIDALRGAGIDTHAVRRDATLRTGLTVALSAAHDRALVTYPGAITALRAEDIGDDLLSQAGHLHVSSYYLQQGLQSGLGALLARARVCGVTTSLDPGFDPVQQWGSALRELLPLLDVFLPNALEACAISGAATPQQALQAFANGVTRTVIKCGAEGAITLGDDGDVMAVPAIRVDAVDSTGAGDSFDAGFLHAWRRGLSLRESLRWGAACGGLSTRGVGGTATQADASDVRRLLAGTP
jgi:sugar/nucleoside kinase (ribokinase family)